MDYQFSKDFLWGRPAPVPSQREALGTKKRRWNGITGLNRPRSCFYEGVGPSVASDFYHKYKGVCRTYEGDRYEFLPHLHSVEPPHQGL